VSDTTNTDVILAKGPIDLAGSWDSLWSAVTAGIGTKLVDLLTIVGVAIVVMALAKWAWDRRRGGGGGGGSSAVWGALLVGALLSAPGVILPIMLQIMDAIANAVYNVWKNAG
jgi:hypothetical protein